MSVLFSSKWYLDDNPFLDLTLSICKKICIFSIKWTTRCAVYTDWHFKTIDRHYINVKMGCNYKYVNILSWEHIKILRGHQQSVISIVFYPYEQCLVSVSHDKTICI